MSRRRTVLPAVVVALGYLAAVGVAGRVVGVPPLVLIVYAALSTVTFVAYAIDKSAARNGRWRISESTLHGLSLAGGWPGALVAQQALRHKTRKARFRVVFWMTVLLNCAGCVWLHTPAGRAVLDAVLAG